MGLDGFLIGLGMILAAWLLRDGFTINIQLAPPPQPQGVTPDSEDSPPTEPSPDVVDYCDQWLDDFAKEDCTARAIKHFNETHDWDAVLTRLGQEDEEF